MNDSIWIYLLVSFPKPISCCLCPLGPHSIICHRNQINCCIYTKLQRDHSRFTNITMFLFTTTQPSSDKPILSPSQQLHTPTLSAPPKKMIFSKMPQNSKSRLIMPKKHRHQMHFSTSCSITAKVLSSGHCCIPFKLFDPPVSIGIFFSRLLPLVAAVLPNFLNGENSI